MLLDTRLRNLGLEPDPEPLLLSKEFRHSWIRKYLCWKKEFGDLDDVTDALVEEVDYQQEMMSMVGDGLVEQKKEGMKCNGCTNRTNSFVSPELYLYKER